MGQRSTGTRLERDWNEKVTRQLVSFCLKLGKNKKKWQDCSISTKNKKAIHSPMFHHHSIIPWGSFRGRQEEKWGSFRGLYSSAKSRKSLFHFKPEKVNKFEYCDNLWKQNILTQCGNWKRVFKIIRMQGVLCVCKSDCGLFLRP